jgi:hypothetical protein
MVLYTEFVSAEDWSVHPTKALFESNLIFKKLVFIF